MPHAARFYGNYLGQGPSRRQRVTSVSRQSHSRSGRIDVRLRIPGAWVTKGPDRLDAYRIRDRDDKGPEEGAAAAP